MRKYSTLFTDIGPIPVNVSILTRVYNLETNPAMKFLVDPWAMYLRNELQADVSWGYDARVRRRPGKKEKMMDEYFQSTEGWQTV